jgi:PAS domain S-box-containing protein
MVSPNLRKMLAVSPDCELTLPWFWTRIHPEDLAWTQEITKRATKEGTLFQYVTRYLPPEGGLRFLQLRGVGILDSAGKPVRCAGVVQDVTEQREAEEKLREREALLTHAEQIANFGSWQTDLAAQKSTASPNMSKILGVSPDIQLTPRQYWERVHPEDLARAREITNRATEQAKPFEYEARFLHPQGGVRFLHVRGVATLDSAGKPLRRVGVVQDITEQREAEEKLREREALLTQAEGIANFGSYQLDFATQKATLSPNLRRILVLGPDEPWSLDLYRSRLHPQDRERVHETVIGANEEQRAFEYVTRYVRPEGGVRILHVRGVPILDCSEKMVRRVGVIQDITDQLRAEEELRRLSQQLLRARDDDRRHIARELHESAGQSLAALKMTLGQLRDTLDESRDSARALLRSATELADAAIREVRTVSYLMHPPMLDEAGLAPALRWYARGFAERSGIQMQVDIPEDIPRLSQEIETTIFRIVQEALTNVHRYSGSRTAQIRIECPNDGILAEVRDDGCGVILPSRTLGTPGAVGVGIAGMRERVKQLNGVFELESAPGKGTTVRVTLPTVAQPAKSLLDDDAHFLDPDGPARSHGA